MANSHAIRALFVIVFVATTTSAAGKYDGEGIRAEVRRGIRSCNLALRIDVQGREKYGVLMKMFRSTPRRTEREKIRVHIGTVVSNVRKADDYIRICGCAYDWRKLPSETVYRLMMSGCNW